MSDRSNSGVAFVRLPEVPLEEIVAHMSDPRVGAHMPLLTFEWDREAAENFVADKEARWIRDGLGHWAILNDGQYAGWGGFQKEGDEWDFGLVLKPDNFGLGLPIARKAIEFAMADKRMPYVTFLLPPSRRNRRALVRFGAKFVGRISYEGMPYLKYQLETAG